MGKSVEIKAFGVDLAVEKALQELETTIDKVEVEVLNKGGLFQKACVKVSVVDTAADKLEEFLNGLLERMGLESRAEASDDNGTLYVKISGTDSGAAIGYRGEALDALQYLALTYLNQEKCDFRKVVVDCEDYREKRKETLTALALRLAEKAHRTCRKIELEAMNPFERRIIHSALVGSEIARTESEGEEPNRHIVIVPLGVELRDGRPNRDRRERNYGGGSDSRSVNYRRGERRDSSYTDRRSEAKDDRRTRRPEEEEVPDGKEYRGYFTGADDGFVKPETKRTGPPKFKSFGGAKKF